MPVAPELPLQAMPEVKSKAPAAKAPEKPAETGKGEGSSFARLYAKERQAKAGTDEPASKDLPLADPAASQSAVADSGKSLPAEDAEATQLKEEPEVDPMLLMAMTGQLPADALPPDAETALDALPVPPPVAGAAPATLTEASLDSDPDRDPLNGVPAVKMALEQGARAAQQAQSATQAAQTAPSSDQDFASALAAFADQPLEAEEGERDAELPVRELSAELAESLGENKTEARNELLASRLGVLSQAIGQQAAQAQRAPALVPGQPVAMNQGGWSEAVVDRVMWLSSQNLKSAEIQLDPQELGRLEVRVNMTQDQTQVTFASPSANVRDALEGQMHRLRELFAQQGMNQLDVNVSDQSLDRGWRGRDADGERRSAGGRGDVGAGGEEEISVSHSEIRPASAGGRGLVDYYA